jgi:hypothetical protein
MKTEIQVIISKKFREAIEAHNLTIAEAGRMLGFKSKYYASMIASGKVSQFPKVSNEAWQNVRDWTNSGETLKAFSEKHNLYVSDYRLPRPPRKGYGIPDPEHIPEPPKPKPAAESAADKLIAVRQILNDLSAMGYRSKLKITYQSPK